MKILVTGGVGFIGTNLIKQLIVEGHEIHSLDNYDIGRLDNEQLYAHYHVGDIETIHTMDSDFDMCFHLAALSRIQPSFENPSETFRVNARGSEAVFEWARKTNTKVIYAGSSSRWHNPYQSPYAMYKFLGEEIAKMYKSVYKTNIEIVRFYNVYGPHEIIDGDWAAVIGIWRRQVRDNLPITIVGDGEQRRDFTHVEDIVDGLIRIAMSNEVHEDGWELGTGVNYSLNEVYEMFRDKFGADRTYIPEQNGNYRKTLRENNAALDRLAWVPTDRLQDYINTL
jgi:UDP-glucose 4-epimerase